jgi:hypothetical protein
MFAREVGVDFGVDGGTWDGKNAANNCCGLYDWAEDGIIGAAEGNGLMFYPILLFTEGDAKEIGQMKAVLCGGDIFLVLKEADIGNAKQFCLAFPLNLEVFAGAHREEEGQDDELPKAAIYWGALFIVKLQDKFQWQCSLMFDWGVCMLVGIQL